MFGRDPFENMFGVPRQPASLTDGRPAHRSGQRVSQHADMSIDYHVILFCPFLCVVYVVMGISYTYHLFIIVYIRNVVICMHRC